MTENKYMYELSNDEMKNIEGGIGLLGGALIGAAVCVAYDVGNEALKNKTGKDVGDWVTYGAGYAIDKAGQGLEYVGNKLQ